jgi:hypothetical protein
LYSRFENGSWNLYPLAAGPIPNIFMGAFLVSFFHIRKTH